MKNENALYSKDTVSAGRIKHQVSEESDTGISQTNDVDPILSHLNHQLEKLSEIIKKYNFQKFKDRAGQLDCICAMMGQLISENNRLRLLQFIHRTGYENIQRAFISLNQVCEESFREEENIFGILKRHRLNYPVPENDSLKLYRISQFLNVTLIHYYLQKRRGLNLTDLQQKIKRESATILKPFLEKLISSLEKEIPVLT
jgi:hypothetical protein